MTRLLRIMTKASRTFIGATALVAGALGAGFAFVAPAPAAASFCNFSACHAFTKTCFYTDAQAYCFSDGENCWNNWCYQW